jgi:hypothetical protein
MSLDDKMGVPSPPNNQRYDMTISPDDIAKDNDYDEIRMILKNVISQLTENTLPELLSIADSSQRADHFRAIADVTKTIIEASRTLMDLNTKKTEITGIKPTAPISQNVLVVGSTAELLKIVKNIRKGVVIEHGPISN